MSITKNDGDAGSACLPSASVNRPVGLGVWKVPSSSHRSCQACSIWPARAAVYRCDGSGDATRPAPPAPSQRDTAALPGQIEQAWQDRWEEEGTFHTPNPTGRLTDAEGKHADPASPSFFVMDMFPYPSGAGLHVGHPLGYIATDVVGRYRRMCGE